MGHDHGPSCSHGYGHAHAPADFGRAFRVGLALNVGIVVLQLAAGLWASSVALIADAGHNLSDVLGLALAYWASLLARRRPTARFTYGFGQGTVLAALFNAVFLLVAVGALSWEAIGRLVEPRPVAAGVVMAVAALGAVLNGFTAWLFASGSRDDLNLRGAFLHMAADAAVSAGVVLSGLVILLTGATWIDPAVSLAVNAVIVWGTWGLLRRSLSMSMAGVPPTVDYDAVRGHLAALPGVARLHDLHIWALSTTETALTAHLVMPGAPRDDSFLADVAAGLRNNFGVGHVTLQVETGEGGECELARRHPA